MLIAAVLFTSIALFSGCADSLWHVSQSSASLTRFNDRMTERALEKRLSRDPLRELDKNIQQGDYRFRGLSDFNVHRQWVPGLAAGSYNSYHVEYLVTDQQSTWISAAERYFTTYNRALIPRLSGKKLDTYGMANNIR